MSPALLLTATLLCIAVAAAAACAVQVLHEFWRHELEDYCLRRGNLEWFSRIIDQREQMALGAQTLQMISLATGAVCGIIYMTSAAGFSTKSLISLMAMTGLVSLVMLAANCWVPWAMLNIAAAPYLYRTWRIWWLAALLFSPLTAGVKIVSSLFQRVTGHVAETETDEDNFEDEFLSFVSEGQHEGHLESDARDMIEGVFELDDSTVAKVMTPRSRVDVIDVHSTWEQMITLVAGFGRTRLPVVDGPFSKASDVIGILFVKDLLSEFIVPEAKRKSLRQLARPPLIVPQSKPLDEMLEQFQGVRSHMAIVVDEYQAIAGVITIEDILEEIVGEIVDEMDEEEAPLILKIDERTVETDGIVRLDQLNDELGLELPLDEDFDTLSGLIMSHIGSIPQVGQTLVIDEMEIEVLQASRRSIDRVKLTLLNADRPETP
jgi:CBS domain containing-hemolysin-like protein